MSDTKKSVTVRVPGSTSNCGAGFDTLGLAFNLYNHVTLTATNEPGAAPVRTVDARASAMVEAAAAAFFKAVNRTPFGFTYRIEGDVPPARGLGSSVTVRAGIVAGLDALAGTGLDRAHLVALVTALEGHPDNAAAGVLGGFCVPRTNPTDGAYIDSVRFEVPPELAFVAISPVVEIVTNESRGALPAKLPYFDAVRSINSAAYLVAIFATRDYARLRHAVTDFMHEPYRLPKIPGAQAALAAGVGAGALTGWLSGSGSSVIGVCWREQAETVLGAMRGSFKQADLTCEGHVLLADNSGLQLV
ncbi:MAG: homoserine kinase [Opitutaceae bacterium]|nr:homoserine kinase [Opitutaceae bacterium]MBP9911827.1 homoserine kinase [Opitutaceae bacterium]